MLLHILKQLSNKRTSICISNEDIHAKVRRTSKNAFVIHITHLRNPAMVLNLYSHYQHIASRSSHFRNPSLNLQRWITILFGVHSISSPTRNSRNLHPKSPTRVGQTQENKLKMRRLLLIKNILSDKSIFRRTRSSFIIPPFDPHLSGHVIRFEDVFCSGTCDNSTCPKTKYEGT